MATPGAPLPHYGSATFGNKEDNKLASREEGVDPLDTHLKPANQVKEEKLEYRAGKSEIIDKLWWSQIDKIQE